MNKSFEEVLQKSSLEELLQKSSLSEASKKIVREGRNNVRYSEFHPKHLNIGKPRSLCRLELLYNGYPDGEPGRVYSNNKPGCVFHNFDGPAYKLFDYDMNPVVELWYLFGIPIEKSDIFDILGEEVTFPLTDEQRSKLTLKFK